MSAVAVSPFERFAAVFREEHRVVRDLLLDLVDAYETVTPCVPERC